MVSARLRFAMFATAREQPDQFEGEPRVESPLGAALRGTAAAIAAAAPLATGTVAHAQTRVVPVVVLSPSAPDYGPSEDLLSAQADLPAFQGDLSVLAQARFFQPASGVTIAGTVLAFLGDGGFTTVARTGDTVAGQRVGQIGAFASDRTGAVAFADGSVYSALRLWYQPLAVPAPIPHDIFVNEPCVSLYGILPGMRLNAAGDVLFPAEATHCNGSARGVYHWRFGQSPQPGLAVRVARRGLAAPGLTSGECYLFATTPQVWLSDAGLCAFRGEFSLPDDALAPGGIGVWAGIPDAPTLLAATGRAPLIGNFPPSATLRDATVRSMLSDGSIALWQEVIVPGEPLARQTLSLGPPGSPATIAATGDILPGLFPGQQLRQVTGDFNDRGDGVIWGTVEPSNQITQPSAALWPVVNGQVRPAVAINNITVNGLRIRAVPGFDARLTLQREVLFIANLNVTGLPNNTDRALLFADRAGRVRPLLRNGSIITLPDGTTRALTRVANVASPLGSPNRLGWVTVQVEFAAGGSGILLVNPRACDADFDASGTLDPDDLADFVAEFFAPTPDAALTDFDGNGTVDPDDLADFVAAFFAGC